MSKTILAEVDGFTPVIDRLAEELGLITAAVFGKAWRFCQLEDGVCRASVEKMAEGLGIDRTTALRHLDKLCEAGYLLDTTPDRRNAPHVYMDTGKVAIRANITVAHRTPTVAQRTPTVADSNKTVAESDLKKEERKEHTPQERKKRAATRPPVSVEVQLFREVTNRFPDRVNYENVQSAIQKVCIRQGRPATADDLLPYYQAWRARGFNAVNLSWLTEWAVSGKIPANGSNGRKMSDHDDETDAQRTARITDAIRRMQPGYEPEDERESA